MREESFIYRDFTSWVAVDNAIMQKMKVSREPVKGTADWFPAEMKRRRYIFQVWREVCRAFNYQEYLTPFLEYAQLYRAKSGLDVGGVELTVFRDRGGRELALRPEMTPGVTRLVTRRYRSWPKPIRLFSIANFFRNEKPQRGRNREFWQLNYDLFGSSSYAADLEVCQIALEIMLAFNPPSGSFVLYFNHRQLLNVFLRQLKIKEEKAQREVLRFLDKWNKISPEERKREMRRLGLGELEQEKIIQWMQCPDLSTWLRQFPSLSRDKNYILLSALERDLTALGYGNWIKFQPSLIRGFDYYDGLIFEVFDLSPQNQRSLFGGGRYNALAEIFGHPPIPAVGAAPGDEPTYLFLESWNLWPQEKEGERLVYLPWLGGEFLTILKVARFLRQQGWRVETGLKKETLSAALRQGAKKGFPFVAICGEREIERRIVILRNLEKGREEELAVPVLGQS